MDTVSLSYAFKVTEDKINGLGLYYLNQAGRKNVAINLLNQRKLSQKLKLWTDNHDGVLLHPNLIAKVLMNSIGIKSLKGNLTKDQKYWIEKHNSNLIQKRGSGSPKVTLEVNDGTNASEEYDLDMIMDLYTQFRGEDLKKCNFNVKLYYFDNDKYDKLQDPRVKELLKVFNNKSLITSEGRFDEEDIYFEAMFMKSKKLSDWLLHPTPETVIYRDIMDLDAKQLIKPEMGLLLASCKQQRLNVFKLESDQGIMYFDFSDGSNKAFKLIEMFKNHQSINKTMESLEIMYKKISNRRKNISSETFDYDSAINDLKEKENELGALRSEIFRFYLDNCITVYPHTGINFNMMRNLKLDRCGFFSGNYAGKAIKRKFFLQISNMSVNFPVLTIIGNKSIGKGRLVKRMEEKYNVSGISTDEIAKIFHYLSRTYDLNNEEKYDAIKITEETYESMIEEETSIFEEIAMDICSRSNWKTIGNVLDNGPRAFLKLEEMISTILKSKLWGKIIIELCDLFVKRKDRKGVVYDCHMYSEASAGFRSTAVVQLVSVCNSIGGTASRQRSERFDKAEVLLAMFYEIKKTVSYPLISASELM
jgi:hypothetical protein